MQSHLTIAVISDRGLVRPHNEDAHAILNPPGVETGVPHDACRLLVVADGLGGHNAGEIASQIAVDTLAGRYRANPSALFDEGQIRQALREAHRRIQKEARRNAFQHGMGTTVALVAIKGEQAIAVHVSDSRVYLIRNGVISRLTLDHSWVEQQVMAGLLPAEAASEHPFRHVITQALGAMDHINPAFHAWTLRAGDIILLCTDGLHGTLDERTIHHVATTRPPEEAAQELLRLAREAGGPDNITLILARVDTLEESP